MAKKYRTEREILTIEVEVNIPSRHLPKDVSEKKCALIKISAYPAAWRHLDADLATEKNIFYKILKEAISKANDMIPIKRMEPTDIKNDFFGNELDEIVYREIREKKGVYHRGKKANAPGIYMKINHISKWLHALFRYYENNRESRPPEVSKIYEERKRLHRRKATKDPIAMTYFCCAILYKSELALLGLEFPQQDSFRTKYLASAGRFRPLASLTPDTVAMRINDPLDPLHVIHEICRKLQK